MPNPRQIAIAASSGTLAMLSEIPRISGTDPTSYLHEYTEPLPPLPPNRHFKLRTTVIRGEPFDVSIEWQNDSFPTFNPHGGSSFHLTPNAQGAQGGHTIYSSTPATCGQRAPPIHHKPITQGVHTNRILVLNTSNEKEPGGGWERGGLTQEEVFSRRSNLVQTLITTGLHFGAPSGHYPIPQTGAVYSPNVVIFRDGYAKDYKVWDEEDWTTISVVSASAVRRPKVKESGLHYAFEEERNLQKEKMKSVLRVAALNGHVNLVLGGFGSYGQEGNGSGGGGLYRNPILDVCTMWEELLRHDREFSGWFANIVFALGDRGGSWMKEDEEGVKIFQDRFC